MSEKNAYAKSGVDVEAGYEVVERIKTRCSYRTCGSHGSSRWLWWDV